MTRQVGERSGNLKINALTSSEIILLKWEVILQGKITNLYIKTNIGSENITFSGRTLGLMKF